ncbi:MAG TPA: acetyl-CoA carboxylase biotin carboxyl carrier protein subunit, partial [Nannocystis exedens]|nr:acetyl-CoA carboxylase biotin carboxyl carrier protein subunit [Nannocystis exedens]
GVALIRGCPGATGPLRASLCEGGNGNDNKTGPRRWVEIDGLREHVHAAFEGPPRGALLLEMGGAMHRFFEPLPVGLDSDSGTQSDGLVRSPTLGRVVSLPLKAGSIVEPSTTVAVVEAMKIETSLAAGVAGTISSVHTQVGAQVKAGTLLVTIEPAADKAKI